MSHMLTYFNILQQSQYNNIIIFEYSNLGSPINLLQMGGTNNDTNARLAIIDTRLVVVGNYTSNPITLFNTDGSVGSVLDNSSIYTNIFMALYD